MMTEPRHNEEGRVVSLPDLVPDPHDHSFIVRIMMMMIMMLVIITTTMMMMTMMMMVIVVMMTVQLKAHTNRQSDG